MTHPTSYDMAFDIKETAKKRFRDLTLLALAGGIALTLTACAVPGEPKPAQVSASATATQEVLGPEQFEGEIANFEALDEQAAPPENAVLAIGSSSMRYWGDTICSDLAPLEIIPRGFGGSTMSDVLYFAGRIVLPYQPSAILLYEGDNDLIRGTSIDTFINQFYEFNDLVREHLPSTHIYVLSIKPSPSRWNLWPQMAEANTLLAEACEADPLLTFIDVATPLLDADGMPNPELFREDNLHMNAKGYAIWTQTVRPVLMQGAEESDSSPQIDQNTTE